MYKELYIKLLNFLKTEADDIQVQNNNTEKMIDILHLMQILENFDELEPIIARYLDEKAQKGKWEKGD